MAEALAPVPAIGLPLGRTGGQAAAHPPVHALAPAVSFWKRYTVRPLASSRICPRPLCSTPTVAGRPSAAFAGVPSARPLSLPLPQPVAETTATDSTAAARRVACL